MKQLAAFCLRFYKGVVSPFLPVACRYVPSCSEYTAEAVAKARPASWIGPGPLADPALQSFRARGL